MAIKFEKIQPGMTLYDRHSYRMGNTTLHSIGEWPVCIISVDVERRSARVSWNGNRGEEWGEQRLRALFDWSMGDDCAEVVKGMWGRIIKVTKKREPKCSECLSVGSHKIDCSKRRAR